MLTVATLLAFLGDHFDLIEALYKAITAGASKDSVKEFLKKAEVEASDQIMKEELGLPPG